ncbi:MAG: [LysW]-lysine hydrolase [Planctomycetota bacterium]|nr:[LysW]-lysine hydrolase [Planctomycetota bacterium]
MTTIGSISRDTTAFSPSTDALAAEFVRELVATRSVSGEEAQAVAVFVEHARRLGFRTEIDEAGNGHAVRRGVQAPGMSGSVAEREIVLLGHIDTVPGEIVVHMEEGVLHGRGTVDAKGPLAAMLHAAARAEVCEGVLLRVIAAVGEETPRSAGARLVAERLRPAACVIGEPSGWDGVTLGYKGRLVVRAVARREGGHSAGPTSSACDAALAFWSACVREVETKNEGRSGAFEVIQAGVREMHSESDGLHDRASLTVGFRLPRWIGPSELETVVREIAGRHGVDATFEGHETAHASDRNDTVVRALSAAIRSEGGVPRPKLKTGTSDMNVVAPVWGCAIAAYGPGDSMLDHTPRERLEIAEYLRSIRVLAAALGSLSREICEAEREGRAR